MEVQSTCFFVMVLWPRCENWYLKFNRNPPLNKTFVSIHITESLVEKKLPFLKIHHWSSLTFSLSHSLFILLILSPISLSFKGKITNSCLPCRADLGTSCYPGSWDFFTFINVFFSNKFSLKVILVSAVHIIILFLPNYILKRHCF